MAKKKRPAGAKSGNPAQRTPVAAPPPRFPLWAIAVPLALLMVAGLTWAIVAVVGKDSPAPTEPAAPTPTAEPENPTAPTSTRRPSGSVDTHRQQLTRQASALLEQAVAIAREPDFDETLVAVAKGDESGLPKSFVSKFRFVDQLADEKEIRAAGLASLLQLGQVLNRSLPPEVKLEPLTANAWEFVYVDMEAGNAFVPLTLFLGEDAAFSFEYVWVDGKWVFSPYSFIDSISAADIAAKGASEMLN